MSCFKFSVGFPLLSESRPLIMADKAWDWTPACFPSPLPYCFPSTQPGLLPNSRTHVLLPAFLLFHLFIHSFSKQVKVKSLSCVQLFVTPWPVACTRLLHPWDFLGKSTGVGCHFLLQGIFPTQGSNPGLPHCRQTLNHLSHQ